MRQDVVEFERFNVAATKEPRYVIKLEYSVSSPHFTSKKGIANVPGVPVQGVLSKLSANSQQLFPEQGRTTIGGFSFDTTDLVGAVTDELRTQLQTNDEGIRGRTVEVYKGFSDDFDDPEWLLINTYIVANVSTTGVGYRFQLTDITREMNDVVFERKKTTLSSSISDIDTTLIVDDTSDFELVFHPNSFTDGPGLTVGYLTLSTGEIVRYTGKTATTFTGVLRNVFGTKPKAIEVDPTTPIDRRPKVEEFIYLEMPGPMLAYAVITGDILGTSPQAVLPAHWHTDVPQNFVRLSDFNDIGVDLFDPNDVTNGLILRFTHLSKTNGKAFVEKQIYLLQGTFSPIYSTGEVGLKRSNRILADAPFVKKLTDANITKLGALKHDQSKVINRFRIDWNWTGTEFTRRNLFIDNDSITTHGQAAVKVLEFRGLTGSRHTLPTLRQLVDTLRDRFSGPPEIIQLNVLPSLEVIEVGDVVRITTTALRDYAGAATLDRSFEVQRRQEDLETGQVILSCFGSSQAKTDQSPTTANPALPDAFYPQEGTDLDSLPEVTGGAITSDLTLTGGTDMTAPANIWFHLGNLTLNVGVTLTIVGNVQLRIRGFFTINGDIDGVGNGIAGSVDGTSIGGVPTRTPAGTGYVGVTRSGDGLEFEGSDPHFRTLPGITVQPPRSNFPQLQLEVIVGSPLTQLNGIPTDLRGSGGSHGAQAVNDLSDLVGPLTLGVGGTGGDGGAGLALVCRGLGTGASGAVDLSGDDGTAPPFVTGGGFDFFPGSGAGGGTGSWLVLLDGSSVTFPVLAGDYLSQIGVTTIQGTPGVPGGIFLFFPGPEPFSGLAEAANFSAVDYSNSTLRIQYVPEDTAATTDADGVLQPPTGLAVRIIPAGIELTWSDPGDTFDRIEILRSLDNDRTNSVLIDTVAPDEQLYTDVTVTADRQYFYWIRSRLDTDASDFDNGGASPDTTTAAIATFVRVLPPTDFVDSFDNYNDQAAFEVDWEDANAGQGGVITFPQDAAEAELGGRLLQAADSAGSAEGEAEYHRRTLIPYDPKLLYKITVRARQTVAPGAGGDQLFAGVTAVAEDGITLLNTAGADSLASQHYLAANDFDMGSLALGEWKEFVGFFTGESTTAADLTATVGGSRQNHWQPGALRTGAKYFRPMFIGNEADGTGTMQVAWWKVQILPKPFTESLRDPTFDLREDDFYWQFVAPGAAIINAGGEDGSNAMELKVDFLNSPNFGGGMTPRALIKKTGIRARISFRYQMTAATGTNFQFQVIGRGYKLRPGGSAVLGSDATEIDNSTDLVLPTSPLTWNTAVIHVITGFNQSDAVQFTFGLTVGSIQSPGQTATVRVQSVEITFYDEFLGAASQFNRGYVPNPVTAQGFFLKDDGTWADAAGGGGPTLPVGAVDHDMAYFSAVPSPDAWSLSSALTGAADYVRFGSPTSLNVRISRNSIEARGLIGQVPAGLAINLDGGQVQIGGNVGFGIRFQSTTPGFIEMVNALSEIRWSNVAKILFESITDRLRINTDLHVNDEGGGNQALIVGEDTVVRGAAQDGLIQLWGEDGSTLREFRITNFGALIRFAMQTGLDVEWEGDGDWQFDIRDGAKVRVRNATDSDWGEQSHDGTSYIWEFVNTLNLDLQNITDLRLVDTVSSPDVVRTVLTDADVKNSIEVDTGDLQLVGDADAPGASRYYGTDASSPPAKGFFVLPTGGPGEKNSIELDAGDHQLVGDVASPGNDQTYGTNSVGARVWKADPGGGGGALITQNTTRNRIENTATETSLFAVSIPGIAVGEIARIELYGSLFNNEGSARAVRWRMTLGGTEFYDQDTGGLRQTWVTTAVRRPWRMTVEIANRSATEALINMTAEIAGPVNFPATGRGAFRRYTERGSDYYSAAPMESAGAINVDMATAKTLDILLTLEVADVDLEITREFYEVRTP